MVKTLNTINFTLRFCEIFANIIERNKLSQRMIHFYVNNAS